jgi:hypothetical protein
MKLSLLKLSHTECPEDEDSTHTIMPGERVLHRMLSKLCKQINIKKHHKEIITIRDYTFDTFESNHDIYRDKNDR